MRRYTPEISAIIAVFGNYVDLHKEVEALVSTIAEHYRNLSDSIELIVVPHGDRWRLTVPTGNLAACGVRILSPRNVPELPALLFNEAAREARGRLLSFAWPGIDIVGWLNWLQARRQHGLLSSGLTFGAGRPSHADLRRESFQTWMRPPAELSPSAYDGGWVEMMDYVPMPGSVISRDYFTAMGGFSSSPILQRGFWWEFTARVSRSSEIVMLPCESPACRWSGTDYPLANDLGLDGDIVARRVVRRTGSPQEIGATCDWTDADGFVADLPLDAQRCVGRLLSSWRAAGVKDQTISQRFARSEPSSPSADPLRVVVLGGMNEPAHNQLCFFNYFELLEGQGVLTWRVILDTAAHLIDVTKADLVIFSRTRSENACQLMDCCNRLAVPTVFMLDDNWFAVGKEQEEYAGMFTPGAKPYENFLYCLTRADHVLTYNPVLAEDLRPHSRNLEVLPVNVKLSVFSAVQRGTDQRPRVGYVGSPRRAEAPFEALAKLAQERDDFDVFLMGSTVPKAFSSVSPNRLFTRSYVFGYAQYATLLCQAAPDILLAPLEETRTDASRCPNKYLEITAAGAVGIYSDTPPYIHFVKDRHNGLLAGRSRQSWSDAISHLLDNPNSRVAILENAQRDVRARFDTPMVLPRFLDFLMRASGKTEKAAAAK